MTSHLAGQARFRIILASTREGPRWYSSQAMMPPVVRAHFEEAMSSPDCNTLVLANEEAATRVARHVKAKGGELTRRNSGLDLRLAVDLALMGGLGLALWCLATLR